MVEEDFKTRLKSAKNRAKSKYLENKEPKTSGMGHAFKMSTELVAAVAVGTIIGFILDNWFGTKPWLILIFFFVGVITGILNVIINHGLVSNQLSKINPIIVPTTTADTNSVLILNAVPIEEEGFLLIYKFFLEILFFAISKRVLKGSFGIYTV